MNTEPTIAEPDAEGCICPQDFVRKDCPVHHEFWSKRTIESRIMEVLDDEEGTEAFNMPATPRQASAALQRLQRKGLATPVRCPDGAWVWFSTDPSSSDGEGSVH